MEKILAEGVPTQRLWRGHMQKVDEYILYAKQIREAAAGSTPDRISSALHRVADEWELLARERLEFLQLKLQNDGSGLN